MEPGRFNAITDVEGVGVGHSTIIEDSGIGSIRSGVTAIVPHKGDVYTDKVRSAVNVYNGYGKSVGLIQVMDMGVLETPILLTDTLNVWIVANAMLDYVNERMGIRPYTMNPVVGETNGGFLNDSFQRPVRKQHVFEALDKARSSSGSGSVKEGNVGGGTPMQGYGFKGGIGTASRYTPQFTIGVLVQLNFGKREDLMINGVPVGMELLDVKPEAPIEKANSIMVVVATDLNLTSRQLWRVAKRVDLGLARTGSYGSHRSGDFTIIFSTAKRDVVEEMKGAYKGRWGFVMEEPKLEEGYLQPVFRATVEATEEAVINALFKAETMVGRDGNTRPAIPLDRVKEIMMKYNRL